LHIHFEWAPGHKGIPGNTHANTLAKEAAEGKSSLHASLQALLHRRLPASTAALKAHRKKTINTRWKDVWKLLPHYKNSLPRHTTSIMTQLCTGHIGLNVFLKKIKAVDSALCSTCHLPETVAHYLLYCCRYRPHR
ncbi:hypothetical protein K439DRAFT_1292883, partial [Ramaria rubella]